jgi:Asp-tRNA(Asn)/Glu-tRNA(Gln) amidotransferase A subunit family amidase
MCPSRGRHSDEGIVPCNIAHDTAGPMGRTAADVAALDAVLTGGVISDYGTWRVIEVTSCARCRSPLTSRA